MDQSTPTLPETSLPEGGYLPVPLSYMPGKGQGHSPLRHLRLVAPPSPLVEDLSSPSVTPEARILPPEPSFAFWSSIPQADQNELIRLCLGWRIGYNWSSNLFQALTLLDHVNPFWFEHFSRVLYSCLKRTSGFPIEYRQEPHDLAFHLTAFLSTIRSHPGDICFAFLYTHPQGQQILLQYEREHPTQQPIAL